MKPELTNLMFLSLIILVSQTVAVANEPDYQQEGIERLYCTGFQQETWFQQEHDQSLQMYPKSYYAALPLSRNWVIFDAVQFIFNDGQGFRQNFRTWRLPSNLDVSKQISPFSRISVRFDALEIEIEAFPQHDKPGFHGGFSCVVTGVGAKPAIQWQQLDKAR